MNCIDCEWFQIQLADYDGEYLVVPTKCCCFYKVWEMGQGDNEVILREYIKKANECCEFKEVE